LPTAPTPKKAKRSKADAISEVIDKASPVDGARRRTKKVAE